MPVFSGHWIVVLVVRHYNIFATTKLIFVLPLKILLSLKVLTWIRNSLSQKWFFRILSEFKVNFSIWPITWWFHGWYSRSPAEVWSSRRRNFQFILFNSLKVYAQIIWCARNRNHVTTYWVILTHKWPMLSHKLWVILLVTWMESSWFVNTILWSATLSLFEIDSAWYRATRCPLDKIAFSCPAD